MADVLKALTPEQFDLFRLGVADVLDQIYLMEMEPPVGMEGWWPLHPDDMDLDTGNGNPLEAKIHRTMGPGSYDWNMFVDEKSPIYDLDPGRSYMAITGSSENREAYDRLVKEFGSPEEVDRVYQEHFARPREQRLEEHWQKLIRENPSEAARRVALYQDTPLANDLNWYIEKEWESSSLSPTEKKGFERHYWKERKVAGKKPPKDPKQSLLGEFLEPKQLSSAELSDIARKVAKDPKGPEMAMWKKILKAGSKGLGPLAKVIPPLGAALSVADAVAAAQAYEEAGVAGLAEHYTASPLSALPGKLGELGQRVGEMGPMGGIPKVARTLADMRREASQKALGEAEVERALKNAEMWRLGESRLTEEEMAPVEGEVEDAELDLGESLLTEAEMAAPTPTEQRRAAAKKALAPQEPTVWFVPTDEEMKLFEEAWAKGEDFWGTPPAEGEDYQWGGVKMRDPETGDIQERVRKTAEAPPSDTGSEEVVEAEVVEEDEKPRTSGRGRLPMADLHLSDLPY